MLPLNGRSCAHKLLHQVLKIFQNFHRFCQTVYGVGKLFSRQSRRSVLLLLTTSLMSSKLQDNWTHRVSITAYKQLRMMWTKQATQQL